MSKFVILGSGMAGFGAAHRLSTDGAEAVMYDKRACHGGRTSSHSFAEGFTIDEGPHISYTSNEKVRALLAESVGGQYETHTATVNNYWQGHWIRHPAQCNLHGLPTDLVTQAITDFVAAKGNQNELAKDYDQWLRKQFGDTFAETFPMEYTKKYHTTEAANLTTDWIGPRQYQPSLEEVLRGALSPDTPNVHYITEFRYPNRGGFVSFLKGFREKTDLRLGHELVRLDPKQRTLHFANGVIDGYDALISSIPLPELVPLIDGAPADVLAAAEKLACSEVVIVSVGINRPDPIDAHWTYFYDEDICFTRLSTPHLQSRNNVPDGHACLMAECYYSAKYRPLDRTPEACVEPVIRDLGRCGVILDDDQITFTNVMHLKYANVIFDHDRAESLATVHGFLDDIGVAYCGRYGHWAYIWTDQAFLGGNRAVDRARKHLDRSLQVTRQ